VRTFSQNDRQLQGTPGAIAVLHTNTRRLDYHPHVHLVMPAAAVDGPRRRWRTKRRGKGKWRLSVQPQGAGHGLPGEAAGGHHRRRADAAGALPRAWVVDCKSVGSGESALIYLGRYLYRGVIAEKDIVACDNGQVSFRYRNARTGRMERRTVSGAQFLWLVLQHVLPKGFRRARNFGFLHPNCKRLIALLHLLLRFAPAPALAWVKQRAPILCACCGAVMVIVKTRIRSGVEGAMPVPLVVAGAF
jgi:hypothetical protein